MTGHAYRRSPYITPEGHKGMSDELSYLWKTKRPQVTQAVADAAAMGDRSENAEYIYGKKQLRQIDARIRYLSKRLSELKVIDRKPADTSRVFFGAWVELEDGEGNVYEYRIVGADEIDPKRNFISIDSPVAKALLRKTDGDEVTVSRPNGTSAFVILSIRY
jgi:transcription elongation factor GreB